MSFLRFLRESALCGVICTSAWHAQGQTPTAKPATATPPAAAAPSDGGTTLSLTANLVNLPVLVRDKKGALVTNLSRSDFVLSVDGHPQTIRYFDRDQNLPLTLGLLVDVSNSMRSALDEERDASSAFLDAMLMTPADRSPDRAFLVQFSKSVELLQDLTNSRPKLQAGIKEIGTPSPNDNSSPDDDENSNDKNANGSGSRRSGGYQHRGGTTLYDAVYLSSDELMKKQQGRKAVVILSDGVDRNSKETLNQAIEAAQRADIVIYAIYLKGEEHHDYERGSNGGGRGYPGGGYPGGGWPGGGGGYPGGGRSGGRNGGGQQPEEIRIDGRKILAQMADETGGRLFEIKGKEKITSIFNQIAEELRSQYRLGYTPDATIAGDGYHQVDLSIPSQKNLRIQTRDGYYSGK